MCSHLSQREPGLIAIYVRNKTFGKRPLPCVTADGYKFMNKTNSTMARGFINQGSARTGTTPGDLESIEVNAQIITANEIGQLAEADG